MRFAQRVSEIAIVRRLDAGKPTHIYKKPDFSHDDSMGKRILLAFYNRLYITTSCALTNWKMTRRTTASKMEGVAETTLLYPQHN